MEIEFGLELFNKYREFGPKSLTIGEAEIAVVEWYSHGYYDFAPYELMTSRSYEVPMMFHERPEGVKRCDYAAKDTEGRLIYTKTLEEEGSARYSRSYIYERDAVCILNHDMKRKRLLGLKYIQYTEDGLPTNAVAVYSEGASTKLYRYTHWQGRCESMIVSVKNKDGLKDYAYDFVYEERGALLKILRNHKEVVYMVPKKFSLEKLFRRLDTSYLKEAKKFIVDNESRKESFEVLAVYYGPERPFSTLSFSLITSEELASMKSKGSIENTWEIWDPQELESLNDFEPENLKNQELTILLDQLWKPNDEKLNNKTSEFSNLLLNALKKKYKKLKYAYACDYECRFLKENLKNQSNQMGQSR